MISFTNVTKTYPGQQRAALDSVTVNVANGEFAFLVGASGSGKPGSPVDGSITGSCGGGAGTRPGTDGSRVSC